MGQKIELSKSDHALDILEKFNQFRKTKQHCDFIIRAGKKEMPVHRFMITASSEYFEAMLSHDTKENKEGIVDMKEVDPECVAKCVNFIYSGEAAVSDAKQRDLLHVAHMLRLQRLCTGIAVHLEKKMTFSSFFWTREIASLYGCRNLVEACNEFALRNFRSLAQLEDFKRLDVDYINFLLSSGKLMERDGIKCKALMKWINYDSERAASLFGLLKCIDFSKVPLTYRKFLVENEPTVAQSMECQMLVMRSVFDKTKAVDMTFEHTPGIIVLDSSSRRLKHFDLQEKKWCDMQTMHRAMVQKNCAVAIVGRYMYVFTEDRFTFRLQYNKYEAKWERMCNRNGNWGDIAVLDGIVYCSDFVNCSNCIEQYDTNQDRWSFSSNKMTECCESAIVAFQGNLCLMGGEQNGYAIGIVEKFHPGSSSWSLGPSLYEARRGAAATTLNNAIYLFGGGSLVVSRCVEILVNKATVWQVVHLADFSFNGLSAYTIDGQIYLVGNNSSRKIKTIEEYDINMRESETICSLADMNVPRFSSVAVGKI